MKKGENPWLRAILKLYLSPFYFLSIHPVLKLHIKKLIPGENKSDPRLSLCQVCFANRSDTIVVSIEFIHATSVQGIWYTKVPEYIEKYAINQPNPNQTKQDRIG